MIDFENIGYLQNGTERQVTAYGVLSQYSILTLLEKYHPVLAGTIPLNIDVEGSDLDILCFVTSYEEFLHTVIDLFGDKTNFKIRQQTSPEYVVATFAIEDFEIEIFGQNMPVKQQYGYRHMLVEYCLLSSFGEEFRQKIIELKRQGLKTEPAFAKLLGLSGNPYEALLEYETQCFLNHL